MNGIAMLCLLAAVIVEPHPTALLDAGEERVDTDKGAVVAKWHKEPSSFIANVSAPSGVEAFIRMPDGTLRKTADKRTHRCPMAEYPDTRVPPPEKVSSDYYVACHYYPGWGIMTNGYSDFKCILNHPDRKPLIGWYDESLPEVADWQVKWALEHGINCFIFCWYREKSNEGKPLSNDSLHKSHQLAAFEKSNYGKLMDFAIMWECDNCGRVTDERDLLENLLPFWVENYFKKPNYLKFGNKPVLFVYECNFPLLKRFGSAEKVRHALAAANDAAKKYGFDGIHFMAENRYANYQQFDTLKACGYSEVFNYCWWEPSKSMREADVLAWQLELDRRRIAYDPKFFILTASQSWDPWPWEALKKGANADAVWRWKLQPKSWRYLLEEVKKLADSLPPDAVGHRFIMLDNWNEWCEGHYIAPHCAGGFKYLQAVREVFTKRDNLPDYRLPPVLGLGPYDRGIDWSASKPRKK